MFVFIYFAEFIVYAVQYVFNLLEHLHYMVFLSHFLDENILSLATLARLH